jgi:large subunit ribosomal protein L13
VAEAKQAGVVVVDASGQIAGRLCSKVAKLLLEGNRVVVVNAAKALISGKRQMVIGEWKAFLQVKSRVHPKYGPFHPRRPDTILARMIRGMVPRKKPKGREALRRLRVYTGVPREYAGVEKVRFEEAAIRKPISYYVSLEELARMLGGIRG